MRIQSLSIVVPSNKCVNNCKFCVSNTNNHNKYDNFITGRNLYFDLYYNQYKERMEYARDNGCNSVILTGDCAPTQNYEFLKLFGIINKSLDKPFRNITIQTTGVLLNDDYLYFLRHHVGVTTISLSVSSFIGDVENNIIIQPAQDIRLKHLVKRIKKYKFTLRLSINLSEYTFPYSLNDNLDVIFDMLKDEYLADQLTFRVLYDSGSDLPQDKWVREHSLNDGYVELINDYIKHNGKFLEKLEYGTDRYSVNGMSTVLDDDCMSTDTGRVLKYTILRPDCCLYTKWDDMGSLLF